MKKDKTTKDADIFTEFEKLPPTYRSLSFTEEQNQCLLKFYRSKRKADFIRLFSEKYFPASYSTLFRQYTKLVAERRMI